MTEEKVLEPIPFKELTKKSLCSIDNSTNLYVDKVASTILINEKEEILAEIIGRETDCDYATEAGRGCHIDSLSYSPNIPSFSLGDILQSFTYGVQYGTIDTQRGIIYRYNYLWFEIKNHSQSAILTFYNDRAQCVYSDDNLRVYVFHIR